MTVSSPTGPRAAGGTDAGIDSRLLEAVIQNSNDAILVTAIVPGHGRKRRITWVNAAFSAITGYAPEEALGKSARFLFDVDTDLAAYQNIRATIDAVQFGHAEVRLRRKDGTPCWLALNLIPDLSDRLGHRAVIVIGHDINERKRVEQVLREQEEFFRTTVENSRDLVAVLEVSGAIRFLSPAVTQILGFAPAEMIGRNAADYFHPDDQDRLFAMARTVRSGSSSAFSHEARFRHKSGGWQILELVGRTVNDRSGRQLWIINGRDVTQRRQAEDALRISEQRFRDFAEVASDWFWEQDADLRFTYISPSVTAVTGRAVGDIVGKARAELYPQDADDPFWIEHQRQLAAHEPFENFRYSRINPDGTLRHRMISGRPFFGADGEFLGYRGAGRDVTAEVEANRRAVLAERRLRDALDSINEGFTLYDENDVLIQQNRQSLLFYPEFVGQIVPGTNYEDIVRMIAGSGRIPAAVGREAEWLAERMAKHRRSEGTEIERQFDDGRWLRISERPTSNGGVVIIQSDITEMKQRQQALLASEAEAREAREAAEAASRAKSAFLASMSHELRTPLNAILGFAETMSTEMFGPLGSAKYVEYASDIHRSGSHLLDLINDILDLSRIEAGRYELHFEATKPKAIIEEAVRLVTVNAEHAGVGLEIAIASGLPPMLLDSRAIRQVLLNLLSNAIKFTPRGGTVSVTARAAENLVSIVVKDTGIGIPASALSRLAKPFEQVENVMTRRNEGSGLGLAISKALIESHRGSLQIESILDAGTTVTIRLPLNGGLAGSAAF